MIFIAIAVSGLVFTLLQSAPVKLEQRQSQLIESCGQLQSDIHQLFPNEEKPQTQVNNPELLQQQMMRMTAKLQGVEGGFWQINNGFFGYAYPTYNGTDIRTDVSQGDKTLVAALAQRAIEQRETVLSVQRNHTSALLSVACPVTTHEGLSIWLLQRSSLAPLLISLTMVGLFVVLGIGAVWMLIKTSLFEKRWYGERDRLVQQGQDESQPVPVTSNINEVQPLLMLLYQQRQKSLQLERQIIGLQAKLGRNNDLTAIARYSSSFAKEVSERLQTIHSKLLGLSSEQAWSQTDWAQLTQEVKQLQKLFIAFEHLDNKQTLESDNESVMLPSWLAKVAAFHQEHSANDHQTITAVCPESLSLTGHLLLLRFVLDRLLVQATTFGPKTGEILLKGSAADHMICIEVIDEYKGLTMHQERQLFQQDDVLPSAYGQGLKLASEAVATLGGELQYESDDENSRFIVRIPMTNE